MTAMRSRLRWRIATLLNRSDRQCWADLVSWATGSKFYRWPWQPRTAACTFDAVQTGRCYCGKLGRDGTLYRAGEAPDA